MNNMKIIGGRTRFYNVEDLNNIKEIMVSNRPEVDFTPDSSISFQADSSWEGFEEGLRRVHEFIDEQAGNFELKEINDKINKAIHNYILFALVAKYRIPQMDKIQEKIFEDGLILDKKFKKDKLICSIVDKSGELIYRPLEINFVRKEENS